MAEKNVKYISNHEKILPDGWRREVRKRKSGKTAGKLDVYFYSPNNKVFRSKKNLLFYIQQNHPTLNLEAFNFNVLEEKIDWSRMKVINNYDQNIKSCEEKECFNIQLKDAICETFDNHTGTGKKELMIKEFQFDNYMRSDGKKLKKSMSLSPVNHVKIFKNEKEKQKLNLQYRSPYFTNKNKLSNYEPVPKYFKSLAKWNPPRSPFNLIQEDLYHDPWKMLVATICLQKTTGKAVKRVLSQLFQKYPTPNALLMSEASDITTVLQPLGLQDKKAKILLRFSEEFVNKNWTYPIELHGIGKYGNDSYRIFCVNEWKEVEPKDHMLEKYHHWLKNQYSPS